MKAQRLHRPAAIDTRPLRLEEVETPEPGPGEIRIRVTACGVCHTDLHLVEGELPDPRLPVTPGHQVVGVVDARGEGAERFALGERVGAYWLHDACAGADDPADDPLDHPCEFCQRGEENLCPRAHWTGYTADGGYAEYMTIPEDFAVPIPAGFGDMEAAPLLCAGVVGYRSMRLAEIAPGERIGLYGFGSSGHICIQVAVHWGCEVYVFSRGADHRQHAADLGAVWTGEAADTPPHALDRAIIFAPAGWIVPEALRHLRPGGTLAVNAIHMSDIPSFPYSILWEERTIRSVANVTRRDAEEFLPLAAEIPIRTEVEVFDLAGANDALQRVKDSRLKGAAALSIV